MVYIKFFSRRNNNYDSSSGSSDEEEELDSSLITNITQNIRLDEQIATTLSQLVETTQYSNLPEEPFCSNAQLQQQSTILIQDMDPVYPVVIDLTEDVVPSPVNVIDLTVDEEDDIGGSFMKRRRAKQSDANQKDFKKNFKKIKHSLISSYNKKYSQSSALTGLTNTTKERCMECLITFKDAPGPLSDMGIIEGLCLGCQRLRECADSFDELDDMRRWLKTGELSVDVWIDEVYNDKEEKKVKNRVSQMKDRLIHNRRRDLFKKERFSRDLPTKYDLYELYKNSECKCAITGWTCHFSRNSTHRFWLVSFDHIVPISTAPPSMNPWTINNLQVLSHVINQIKGNCSDDEVRRWYRVWMDANE